MELAVFRAEECSRSIPGQHDAALVKGELRARAVTQPSLHDIDGPNAGKSEREFDPESRLSVLTM